MQRYWKPINWLTKRKAKHKDDRHYGAKGYHTNYGGMIWLYKVDEQGKEIKGSRKSIYNLADVRAAHGPDHVTKDPAKIEIPLTNGGKLTYWPKGF